MMRLPSLGLVPEHRPGGDDGSRRPGLDIIAHLIVDAVDGCATIAAISDQCGLDPELTARVVGDLAQKGVLHVPGFELEPPPTAATEPPPAAVPDSEPPDPELAAECKRLLAANYYDVLGVEPDATRQEVRAAYFLMSKKYHPDRHYGRRAAQARDDFDKVFRRITAAYETLSAATRRASYDASLGDAFKATVEERQRRRPATAPASPPAAPASRSAAPASPSVAPASPPAAPASGAVSGAPARPSAPPAVAAPRATVSSIPPGPGSIDPRREAWKRERLNRALGMLAGPTGKASLDPDPSAVLAARHAAKRIDDLPKARMLLESGQGTKAIKLLTALTAKEPTNSEAQELLEKAKQAAVQEMAQNHIRQGLCHRRQGRVDEAVAHFERAVAMDRRDIEARHLLAELLVENMVDLPRALALMREVIAMGGQKARYFATLGEILFLAKELERARDAFERALSMEPGNKEWSKRLKACGGTGRISE